VYMRVAPGFVSASIFSARRLKRRPPAYELRRLRKIAAYRRRRLVLAIELAGLVLLATAAAVAGGWLGMIYKD
ncbi:MAG: hypothetical protein ACRD3E_11920, partial [Terriglobales bacterium]